MEGEDQERDGGPRARSVDGFTTAISLAITAVHDIAMVKRTMWRREVLDAAGGLAALGSDPAEDAAATRLIRSIGRTVELVDMPFEQPLGIRSAREVWARHTRWGRLRRATFPLHLIPEIFTGALPPVILAALGGSVVGASVLPATLATAGALYAAELALVLVSGAALHWYTLPAMIVRDLMLPALYVDAWLFDRFEWHGHNMSVSVKQTSTESAGLKGSYVSDYEAQAPELHEASVTVLQAQHADR